MRGWLKQSNSSVASVALFDLAQNQESNIVQNFDSLLKLVLASLGNLGDEQLRVTGRPSS